VFERVAVGQHKPTNELGMVGAQDLTQGATGVVADDGQVAQFQAPDELGDHRSQPRRRQVGAVVALTVYGALPIIANTVTGLDGVDPRLVEAAHGMGMSSVFTLLRVELPLALPVIVAGVRTALVLIVGTAALASFTGGGGLGQLITTGIKLQQHVTLIVGAILVAALALFIDWLARIVEMVAAPKGL
jgi:ABC-type proline/glycine betaine transport system permease subunit